MDDEKRKTLIAKVKRKYIKYDFLYVTLNEYPTYIQDKVFKNGPSELCGRQPLENLK